MTLLALTGVLLGDFPFRGDFDEDDLASDFEEDDRAKRCLGDMAFSDSSRSDSSADESTMDDSSLCLCFELFFNFDFFFLFSFFSFLCFLTFFLGDLDLVLCEDPTSRTPRSLFGDLKL
mmetsp:Transcript_54158/g.82063  ORF Transcript_54158/g.82063 Transcript_54158/m.82063 type:complete len:119 (-) Transcript_54158:1020-1376(-)